jgi:hypothetical protein
MAGLIGNAPIYVNGVLSLFFVFVLPGLALVSFLDIPDFPRRWLVVLLTSLLVSHALVVLVAALHLDPLLTFRLAVAAVVGTLVAGIARQRYRRADPTGGSVMNGTDLCLLAIGLIVLALTYFNIWKHGVPNVFGEGDVSISWNSWALIWSQGNFPTGALGYPQFIPTIWAVTYIFTGSTEQYFAFYIYIGLITVPLLLTAMTLGRIGWWQPVVFGLTFIWFIAEIQEHWLRATLQEGFPDWVVAVFTLCGFALFVTNAPDGGFDRTKVITGLSAICMLSIAAATKPMYGLVAIALLLATIVDGYRHHEPAGRNRFLIGAVAPLAIVSILYAIYYAHLIRRGMPNYPTTELMQRLSQTWSLFYSNFTLPFKMMVALGLLCGPFLPRIRWVILPAYVAFAVWANTAGYDLRNVLGFLLISAFIPIYTAGRVFLARKSLVLGNGQWRANDGVVAAVLAIAVLGLTSTLAMSDSDIKRRFADDQLRRGQGTEFNRDIGALLDRGCTLFTSSSYPHTISAFRQYHSRMEFFFYSLPMDEATEARFRRATGCVVVLYPLDAHPSIQAFIADYVQSRSLQKLREGGGMVLAASRT